MTYRILSLEALERAYRANEALGRWAEGHPRAWLALLLAVIAAACRIGGALGWD